jgi:uncharacterized protein (TIGR02145 family)
MKNQTPFHHLTLFLIIICLIFITGCNVEINNPFIPVDDIEIMDSVSDIDGNVYHILTIDSVKWMVENLKTTHYNDSKSIPMVTVDKDWKEIHSAAYCWYNNDSVTYKKTYGALYNSWAVSSDKLCPAGWHVASESDWSKLEHFVGGDGGSLKETDTLHWKSPNRGATNESGFTAFPGGQRSPYGEFWNIGEEGSWWRDTVAFDYSYVIEVDYDNSYYSKWNNLRNFGNSVRCVKD